MPSTFEMLQQGAAAHNAQAVAEGRTVNMSGAPQPSQFGCPTCKQSGKTVRMFTFPTKRGFGCNNGHEFNDLDALIALNPEKLPPPAPPIQPPQPGSVELKLMVHQDLKSRLETKFGAGLSANVAALLGVMLDPNAFVVAGPDLVRLADPKLFSGEVIKDANKLIGLVFALKARNAELEEENTTMRQAASGDKAGVTYVANAAKGDVIVNFGIELTAALVERAKGYGIDKEQLVVNTMKNANDNGWL